MEKIPLLIITENQNSASELEFHLQEENLIVHSYIIQDQDDMEEIIKLVQDNQIKIIMINMSKKKLLNLDICKNIRKRFSQQPLQIILLVNKKHSRLAYQSIELGGDDFIPKPIEPLEFKMRLRAAQIRLESQLNYFSEKEFYKRAVKQEQELASRILGQNLYLKRAYRNIESLNKDLERANRELEQIAKFDILSGLLNRLSLFHIIDMEVERAIRSDAPLCGIMMDIDHFKLINDTYGHPCGDLVIKEIGQRLRMNLRKYDRAGRYGGEEFFIILPNTGLLQAKTMAERFRQLFVENAIEYHDEEIVVTASFGVAEFKFGESKDMWISRTDRAMYRAKRRGRNTVCTA